MRKQSNISYLKTKGLQKVKYFENYRVTGLVDELIYCLNYGAINYFTQQGICANIAKVTHAEISPTQRTIHLNDSSTITLFYRDYELQIINEITNTSRRSNRKMYETHPEDFNRHRKARVLFPKEIIIKALSENEDNFLSRNGKSMW